MRQIILDTETTGLEPHLGHRIIEIGGVEVEQRRRTERCFHHYLNPDRDIDAAAMEVHGISRASLADKPRFPEVMAELLAFIDGAELIIHNAPFDLAFLDRELTLAGASWRVADRCEITDSLALARHKHPGQSNALDALCRRYGVDSSNRTLHGALLDAEILAEVYLLMTGGQTALSLDSHESGAGGSGVQRPVRPVDSHHTAQLRVVRASREELAAHGQRLDDLDRAADGGSLWRRLEAAGGVGGEGGGEGGGEVTDLPEGRS